MPILAIKIPMSILGKMVNSIFASKFPYTIMFMPLEHYIELFDNFDHIFYLTFEQWGSQLLLVIGEWGSIYPKNIFHHAIAWGLGFRLNLYKLPYHL